MICPYCSQSIHLNKTLSTAVQSGGNPQTQVNFVGGECPSCHGIIVICSSLIKGVANDDECRRAMVFPKNRAVRLVSPDIPHELAEDFVEACAVLDVSPKASAALSRRLLQRTLHERFSINRPNLQQEILRFSGTAPGKGAPAGQSCRSRLRPAIPSGGPSPLLQKTERSTTNCQCCTP